MDFKAFGDKAKEMAGAAAASAPTTAGKMLDEFNEALPTMRALGFVVKDLHVDWTRGARWFMHLKGLYAAYNIKREIPDVPLKGVQLDLTMTLPPRVSVSFVNNVVAAA